MMRPVVLIVGALLSAACGKPFWSPPPPRPEPVFPSGLLNVEVDSIALIQTPCMASCPTNRYLLRRDGSAEWEARDAGPRQGRYTARLSRASFDQLVALLRRKHFFTMARRYEYPATDHRSIITRVFLADTMKEVDRYGPAKDAPRELYEIEVAIENAASGLRWQYQGPGRW